VSQRRGVFRGVSGPFAVEGLDERLDLRKTIDCYFTPPASNAAQDAAGEAAHANAQRHRTTFWFVGEPINTN
jgi:hypothetical protein